MHTHISRNAATFSKGNYPFHTVQTEVYNTTHTVSRSTNKRWNVYLVSVRPSGSLITSVRVMIWESEYIFTFHGLI